MRITCPHCETRYDVPDAKIGTKGRQVRCARCGTRWHATASVESDEDDRAAGASNESPRVDAPGPSAQADDLMEAGDTGWLDAAPAPRADAADTDGAESAATDRDADAFGPDPDPWASALDESPEPPPAPAIAKATDAPPELEAVAGDARTDGSPDVAEPGRKPADVETVARRPAIRVKKPPARKVGLPKLPKLPKLEYRAAYTRAKPYVGLFLFLLALALPTAGVVFRYPVVAALPSMAGLYEAIGLPVNLRGLVFEGVDTIRELEGGQPVLVVEGAVHNPTDRTRPLPSIRLSLRSDDQQEIYAWSVDPKATSVAPGASVRFRTKLAAPPDEARDVQLRFTERRSRQAANP